MLKGREVVVSGASISKKGESRSKLPAAATLASEAELATWVETVTGGKVVSWHPISGGNRCLSWLVGLSGCSVPGIYLRYQLPRPPSAEPYTVRREADIYETIQASGVKAPKLLATHPVHEAIITEQKPGRAEFRSLDDKVVKQRIALDFVETLADLHAMQLLDAPRLGFARGMRVADCVHNELDIWHGMYAETGQSDPLIEFAMRWLYENLPDPDDAPVLAHGDAGPGNFLFDNGRMTALIDWELAHPGDPMEDLAWFSMRSVMEPVPDFVACLRHYEEVSGRRIDLQRLLYHRVFVSARVVIIRHRNASGLPGNSIVSRALNRRLLVDALAEANDIRLKQTFPIEAADTAQSALFDGILEALRDDIVARSQEPAVVSAAKNGAKVLKYLREVDRLGAQVERAERDGLEGLLGSTFDELDDGRRLLLEAIKTRRFSFESILSFFAGQVAREAQLAAPASGGVASRNLPDLGPLKESA